jgi:aspartokinase/homoserine dehydrogenase 1
MTAGTAALEHHDRRPKRGAARSALAIYKFGGAALADGRCIHRAAALVAARAGAPTLIVVSALAGVTDALIAVAHAAARGATVGEDIARLRNRHLAVVAESGAGSGAPAARDAVLDAFADLGAMTDELGDTGQLGARTLDRILAHGECLAARILAAAVQARGTRVSAVDARSVICTNGRHGHATPDVEGVRRAAADILKPLLARDVVPIVPGFIGRGPTGDVVTLGRGGSDLTATLLARVLDAREVVLWKDVPGVLTADPRAVPDARLVPQISAREAAVLASLGAKVLHPRALAPFTARTRLSIRPFAEHAGDGTAITARLSGARTPIKAIAASSNQALLTISVGGFLPIAELAARAYAALDEAGVAGSIRGQTSSADAISFTLLDDDAQAALAAMRHACTEALANGDVSRIAVHRGVTTIGVVGAGLAARPELVTRAFDALATAGVDVIASLQRPGDVSLSVIVDASRGVHAQRALHDAFQLDKLGSGRAVANGQVDVVLLGVGAIGRELLAQVAATRSPVRICGLIDTSGYVFDARGFSRSRLADFIALKSARRAIAGSSGGHRASAAEAFAAISDHALARPVLVDATAADTGDVLEAALRRGWDLVLANKLPLAAEQPLFDRLRRAAATHSRQVLHEATVGAGLPVIDTLRKLQQAGDRVLRIEGCPSGTLGFLFGELGRGQTFSRALRRAVQLGYTEPDPRVDLSGADVARKALILARLIGFRGSLADVHVESLVPEQLRDVSRTEFLARFEDLDGSWESRVHAARAHGRVLRYRARVTKRAIEVGLVAVGTTDALGALDGTDNQFAFTTTRYREQPLVITGPGAGPAVTAAGVYNDLLRLTERGVR